MRATRVVLGALGLMAIGWGLWSVRGFSPDQLVSAAFWLGGGVLVHDAILAPLVVAVGIVLTRFVPAAARGWVVAVAVVWGTTTVVAAAVLSGMGGRPDNATLLDRSYVTSWVVLTILAVLGCVLAVVGVSRASNTRSD